MPNLPRECRYPACECTYPHCRPRDEGERDPELIREAADTRATKAAERGQHSTDNDPPPDDE